MLPNGQTAALTALQQYTSRFDVALRGKNLECRCVCVCLLWSAGTSQLLCLPTTIFAGRESGICLTNTSHYNLLIVMVFLVIEAIQDRVRFQDLRRSRSGDGHRCRIALADFVSNTQKNFVRKVLRIILALQYINITTHEFCQN